MAWIGFALAARIADKSLEDPIQFVINTDEVRRQVRALQAAFPKSALHAFAAKANPLTPFLHLLNELGMGCEAASICEFEQARRAFPGDRIVFDSPCKTAQELQAALYNAGGFLNLDNFQELERVVAMNAQRPVTANVGLRVNAQLGTGAIAALSTGGVVSKFGIGLKDSRQQIIDAYRAHSFLNMVHVHSGSQGLDFAAMTGGVRAIMDLVKEIEDTSGGGTKRIPNIDIGGGLSVNFASDEQSPTFGNYAEALQVAVPELFAEGTPYRIITEFGRAIVMKAGVYLSRIEYTKVVGGRHIILQHVGADLLLRTAWQPDTFPLHVEIFDKTGQSRAGQPLVATDVAGPCCFQGDMCARDRMLPCAEPGDFVVVKDVGGYYYVSYNYYNLRQAPACFFFDEATKALTMVRRADTVAETQFFFDKPPPQQK